MKEIENCGIKLILKLQFIAATCRGYCTFQRHDKYSLKPYSFSDVLCVSSHSRRCINNLKLLCILVSVPWFVVELPEILHLFS